MTDAQKQAIANYYQKPVSGSQFTDEQPNLSPLMQKIEEAIRLAAQLGPNAFDFIEGRGLHQMRLDIDDATGRLMAENRMLREVVRQRDAELAEIVCGDCGVSPCICGQEEDL